MLHHFKKIFLQNLEQTLMDLQHLGDLSHSDEKYLEQRLAEYEQLKNYE